MKLDLKSPAVQKFILSIMLSGGILGGFFFSRIVPFTYPSQKDQLAQLKSEYEKKSTELARARATVADLPRFEAEYESLHERWAMAAELLPTEKQMPTLLRRITLAAQQTGVEFVVFRPNDERPDQHYTEMPLSISVFGQYHQIGSFIAELANMQRIVTVSNLKLKSHSKGETATTAAEFTASAYSLNASSALPAPPAPDAQQTDDKQTNAKPSDGKQADAKQSDTKQTQSQQQEPQGESHGPRRSS
jgi:type IV pilus assembly protein PilO